MIAKTWNMKYSVLDEFEKPLSKTFACEKSVGLVILANIKEKIDLKLLRAIYFLQNVYPKIEIVHSTIGESHAEIVKSF